ncbi:hypothetical protein XU18_3193 [Perkinsela sp. CCAP 1560/4]|nr:hypothetical protein XU18_3193 [Perkinsela sp. CCAP 1560/4]|eukprot:KNH05853.1 hypothetical protein XU18_3193 [Perkinsela sp. CCAP 1560/4]
MFKIAFVACADDAIGRFGTSMLSQQSLMELFIFGLDKVDDICGSRENPTDVCSWKGIKCNKDGDVEAFKWSFGANGAQTILAIRRTLHLFTKRLFVWPKPRFPLLMTPTLL